MNSHLQFDRVQRGGAAAAARANRERLRLAGVYAINLIGGPGCGKTSLIEATMRQLLLKRRVGAIAADPHSRYDADRLSVLGDPVIHVDPGVSPALAACHVGAALGRLDLSAIDLLLIENVSSLVGPGGVDLGESAKVAVFSVAAGHDKPARHPDVVHGARVVVLNKMDLSTLTPFNLAAFREAVARLNPDAAVLEMSTLTGQGMDAWADWLLSRSSPRAADALRGAGSGT
jgi:hydrogenase nickel incorporation protein HypB